MRYLADVLIIGKRFLTTSSAVRVNVYADGLRTADMQMFEGFVCLIETKQL